MTDSTGADVARQGRLKRTEAVVVAAVGLFALAAGIGAGAASSRPTLGSSSSSSGASPATATVVVPASRSSGCTHVTVLTGQVDTPYYDYGRVVAGWLEGADGGWTTTTSSTRGTADNIKLLTGSQPMPEPDTNPVERATCTLSMTQFNTAYDAVKSRFQFNGQPPRTELRAVGPIWYDIVHLIVRAEDSNSIQKLADLCDRRVNFGLEDSGTYQITQVLFQSTQLDRCGPRQANVPYPSFPDALSALGRNDLDAVFWAAGAPSSPLTAAIDAGLEVALVPLDSYVDDVAENWDDLYGRHSESVFTSEYIAEEDYSLSGRHARTGSFAAPNGLLALDTTDPTLVEFVTRKLFGERADLEQALWPNSDRHFYGSEKVRDNPVFCLVPPHPAAVAFYRQNNDEPAGCAQ